MGNSNTIPERIGRYRIVSQLGRGAMATVYRAIQEGPHGFEPEVALKLFDPSLVASQPAVVGMIVDEARIASRLKHPGIVRILDLVEDDGQLYTVMDCVDGPSMRQILDAARLARRAPDATAIVAVLAGACEGLHAAHTTPHPDGSASGLVHRDIKPGNILVTRQGEVRVSDFGIAIFSDRVAEATAHGQLKGTPAYMSPEQVFGEPMDARSDIFSMGLTLFTLCTTRLAFTGESPMKIAVRIAEEPMDSQALELDALLPGLGKIFSKACAKEPADRYRSAKALGTALSELYMAQESPATILDLLETWTEGTSSQELETEESLAHAELLADDEPETDPNMAALGPLEEQPTVDSTEPGDLSPAGRYSAAAGFADLAEAPTDEVPLPSQEQSDQFQTELQSLPTLDYDHSDSASSSVHTGAPIDTPILGLNPLQAPAGIQHMPKGAIDARPGEPTGPDHSAPSVVEASQTSLGAYRPERDYRGRVVHRKAVDPKSQLVSKGEKIAVAVTGGVLFLAVVIILVVQLPNLGVSDAPPQETEEAVLEPDSTVEAAAGQTEIVAAAGEPAVEESDGEQPSGSASTRPTQGADAAPVVKAKAKAKVKAKAKTKTKAKAKAKAKTKAKAKAKAKAADPVDGTNKEEPRARAEKPGTLTVNTYPYSKVWVDGKLVGQTPLRAVELSVGLHEVKLVFPTLTNREEVQTVRIQSNKESKLVKRLSGEGE